MEEAILSKKRELIKELTQTAWNIMATYHRLAERGIISQKEAQTRALGLISTMRYGPEGKDYFWINDRHPYMIMHPYRRDLDGRDLSKFADPEGKLLFVEFVAAVKKGGSGYVGYKWQWKDDPQRIVPKISFVKEFKPWGWIVGTGIYIEDVKAEMHDITRHLTLLGAVVLTIVAILSSYIIYRQMKTEHHREAAEQAHKETLEKNRAVLESSPDPMVVYDNMGKATYLNPAFTRVFGWEASELLDKKIDFVPADKEAEAREALAKLYSGRGDPVAFETSRLTKEGGRIDVALSAAVYRNANGAPVGVVVNLKDISEFKRVERALRESETLFRSITSNALDAIVMIDTGGRCIFWNKAAEKIFGYSAGEILGQELHHILLPDRLHEQYESAFRQLSSGGQASVVGRTLQLAGIRKNGQTVDMEVSISSLQLHEQWFAIGIVRDITERKQAEQAIVDSESRYRTVFDAAHHPTFLLKDGRFADCNVKTAAVFGASKDDFMGRTPGEFSPEYQPDGKLSDQRARELMAMALAGEVQVFEWQHTRLDGSTFDAEVSLTPTEVGGEPYLLATVRDITQYKRDEEERLRLAAAIEQAAEDVIITDKDGRIQYVNPAFEKVTGYRRSEVIGQKRGLLGDAQTDKTFHRQLWKTVERGEAWTGRITIHHKDGRIIHQSATVSPIRDSAGNISGYVSVKRDISKQIRLESQLRQAHKMEAIGTLAGGIAHDFNNILGAIIGFTELSLASAAPNSQAAQNMNRVLDAASRAAELVKQILTFSRQSEQEARPVDIGTVAEEVVRMLQATLPATIEIQHAIEHNVNIMGDPTQIQQVILNLCTNAAQAMRSKGGQLSVSLDTVELQREHPITTGSIPPGVYHKLTVRDTGHGMDKEIIERVFEPFFTTKEKGEGTGLGLAVVHGIVTSHGGAIDLRSRPGAGTTFEVYFPEMPTTGMGGLDQEGAAPMPTGHENILLVDDEEMLLEVWQELLGGLGYRTTAVDSGHKALEFFQEAPHAFDLMITDYTMPQMTGLELAERILAIRSDLPIILCTGYSEQITGELAISKGIKRFVMKPIVTQEFASIIREVLDQAQSGR